MRIFIKSFLICFLLLPLKAFAVLDIKITQGIEEPIPIAVAIFGWSQASNVAPIDMTQIITSNLARSGRFDVMDVQDLPQNPTEFNTINFGDWRKLGMENIVIGNLVLTESGNYDVSFRLIDIFRKKQIAGFRIPTKENLLRRVAHQISDIVFEKLTGIQGAFNTRVAYITVKKDNMKKTHALHIADADGYNTIKLVESSEPLLSPSWSHDGKKIAYVSFEGKNSSVFIQDVITGNRTRVAKFEGINSSPNWSPDDSRLALTLSKDGNTEIYIMNLTTKSLRRVTNHDGIDTEPTWSPDGEKLAFTSDRSGSPQIYEVAVQGGKPKRLSFEGKYNARPKYAPDGKSITLVHSFGNTYHIAILSLDNGYINVLTNGPLDESPSYAPNGSMVIYATAGRRGGQLAAISVDGRIKQRLGLDQGHSGDVREPAWGPFLK